MMKPRIYWDKRTRQWNTRKYYQPISYSLPCEILATTLCARLNKKLKEKQNEQ